jgi:predicted dehydrogenase
MSSPRAAIIGYGLAGRTFHSNLLKGAGFEISAVLTTSPARVAQVHEDFPSASVVSTVAQIIALKPDVVVVASPNSFHAPQAIELLRAGIPVVIDKPMALNAKETEEIISVSESEGVAVTTFFNRRWDSDALTIKKILSEGILGNVFRFEARFGFARRPVQQRGALRDRHRRERWHRSQHDGRAYGACTTPRKCVHGSLVSGVGGTLSVVCAPANVGTSSNSSRRSIPGATRATGRLVKQRQRGADWRTRFHGA